MTGITAMDIELPEELKLLKRTVKTFVDGELIPIEMKAMDGPALRADVRADLERKAKDLGLWLLDVPAEYGGQGLSLLGMAVVWEELSRTIALPPRGPGVFGPDVKPVLFTLNAAQKEKYLFPVLRGEKTTAFAQSEPDAGSDPGAMRTTAVRKGDHYVINGYKRWITKAQDADFLQLVAATDRSKGSRGGLSMFLVDTATPGVKIVRRTPTMMSDMPCEIALDDVVVPVENLIGRGGDAAGAIVDHGRPPPSGVPRARRRQTLPRARRRLRQAARHLRRAARRAAGGAVHDRRQLYRASHDAADGVPPRGAHRRRRCRPARKLYGQDRGHRARLSRRRPLPADSRRHGARDRDADLADVARCAQLHDHRGSGGSDAHGACARNLSRSGLGVAHCGHGRRHWWNRSSITNGLWPTGRATFV